MITWKKLLNDLPPFQEDIKLIDEDQGVRDIIRQVKRAHRLYSKDYDLIADHFAGGGIESISKRLFDFCVKTLSYKAEPIEVQTTMSPGGILLSKNVDCKHYALFTGGILDALNRSGNINVEWCYRFASYNPFKKVLSHVFVVVYDRDREIWIDPAPLPGGGKRDFNDRYIQPYNWEDKKVSMALYQISGFNNVTVVERSQVGDCDCRGVGDMTLREDIQMDAPIYDGGPVSADTEFEPVPAQTVTMTLEPAITVPLVSPPMPKMRFSEIPAYLRERAAAYNYSVLPGIEYYSDNVKLRFPGHGSKAPLPQNLLVTYPAKWEGHDVPADCPRPVVIGNRLCFLPKLGTWQYLIDNDFSLFKMCVGAMMPMISCYSQFPDWKVGLGESYEHEGTLANVMLYDLDRKDVVDYVTSRPIVLPREADLPRGVRYVTGGLDLQWPPDRQLNSVEYNRNNPPPPLPVDLQVIYPATYLGVAVPEILPRIIAENGKLFLTNKDHMVDTDYRGNNFMWYTFLVQTIAPLINAYAQFPYVGSNDQLARRVWDDVIGVLPIDNYLPPPEGKTWLGEIIQTVGEYIHTVTMWSLKFVNAPMRLCFLGLVRINFAAFGYKLFWSLQNYEKRRKLYATWRDIGGSIGELDEAIVLGCKNNPVFGGSPKQWIEDCVASGEITYNCQRPADDPQITDDIPTNLPHPTDPAWNDLYEPGKEPNLSVAGVFGIFYDGKAYIGVVGADDVVYYLAAATSVIAALAAFLKGIGGPKTDKIVDDAVNGMNVILAAAGEDPIKLAAETGKPVEYTDPKTGLTTIIYPPDKGSGSRILDLIKANPVESALVGGALFFGIRELVKGSRPRPRRA